MIRSSDGQVLWAEGGLAVEGRDLLEAEDLVATTIASRLRRSLTLSEQGAISRRLSPNAEAYEFFVRGKLALRKGDPSGEQLLVAEKLLLQATALDPNFPEAFAWHAIVQYSKFSLGLAGDEAKKASLENAWKALALDPTVTAARRALIGIFHSTGQAEEGLKQASILRQSGATDSDSLVAMAQAYLRAGMPDRSIPLLQRALELDPQDEGLPGSMAFAANCALQYDLGLHVLQANPSRFSFSRMLNARGAGQHEVARSAALETMREAGPFAFAICWLTLKELGGMEEANRLWRSRSAAFERDSVRLRNERVRIGLGIMYAALGERRKALDQLRLTLETNPGDLWSLFFAAEAYGLLDDHQRALESLQQAVNQGFLSLFYLDHQFEHPPRGLYRFRDDPRFRTIRDQLATKIQRLRDQY